MSVPSEATEMSITAFSAFVHVIVERLVDPLMTQVLRPESCIIAFSFIFSVVNETALISIEPDVAEMMGTVS